MGSSALDLFQPITRQWFEQTLGNPTAVQAQAWPAIAAGGHTLVAAPTGTGKTLSAFLVFIDALKAQKRAGTLPDELQIIYISPLKSLAGDIRENLRKPLNGITAIENELYKTGIVSGINVAVRTGDTSGAERQRMLKKPPHILITTPESLYLLATGAQSQKMLQTARVIIIDELHAVIDSKRGAHLMLTIARLDKLCGKPLQRIGLSATIEPLEAAARYLACDDAVTIAAPVMNKAVEVAVVSPLQNMLLTPEGGVWQEIARAVYEHCEGARSVIAFVDQRAMAEKLAFNVNKLGGEGFACTHHGCVSKEQRQLAEQRLRNGELRLLCATSSMELGIDVGDIDRVLQIGCPHSVSSLLQRLGRAGHNPGRVSVMHMFPRTASEALYSGLTAKAAMDRRVEHICPPRQCFDVLAQHLVSMTVAAPEEGYTLDEVCAILQRAYPFKDVTRGDVHELLCMLAGDYEHKRDLPVRPRLLYDRLHERFEGDTYSRMLAVSTAGTIPDTGQYAVRTENGVKIGEVDEEFVFERERGFKFMLGAFAWKIISVDKDTVTVTQTNTEGASMPFWRFGAGNGRQLQTGVAFGQMLRELTEAAHTNRLPQALRELGMDDFAAENAAGFVERQILTTGVLPDDRTIIVEHFADEQSQHQLMIHSVFGQKVNAPLGVLLREAAKSATQMDVDSYADEDGVLLQPRGCYDLPSALLQSIHPSSARPILEALLPSLPQFAVAFRHNSARALLMGVRSGKRNPLWIQRMRAAELLDTLIETPEHPMIRETKRECLEDYWDLDGLEKLLEAVQSGELQVLELTTDAPSPMTLPLRYKAESELMYNYTPSTSRIGSAASDALRDALATKPTNEQLALQHERKRLPENEKQLHTLLMTEGDVVAGELDIPIDWFESLAVQGRALYIEPGLWIAAEQADEYTAALESQEQQAFQTVVRRSLRYKGAQTVLQLSERYVVSEGVVTQALQSLLTNKRIVRDGEVYFHADLYERAQRATISWRRKEIQTQPPQRFAALLTSRLLPTAPPSGQLDAALAALQGQYHPAEHWESLLFPTRVNGYTPSLLDTALTKGQYFWRVERRDDKDYLAFEPYDAIDWQFDLATHLDKLDGDDRVLYQFLLQRGASFVLGMSNLLEGRSVYDSLISLVQKGLVHTDSFKPIRQLTMGATLSKLTAKRRAQTNIAAMSAGRFDTTRPTVLTWDAQLDRAFAQVGILCRETARQLELPWQAALETLRVWEYTGRARRGYFIEGLSGAQFIKDEDFTRVVAALEHPIGDIVWLSAADSAQPWGKVLAHNEDRAFMNLATNAVALKAGQPIAVLERSGQVLRVFEPTQLHQALEALRKAYSKQRIFSGTKYLTIKKYPPEAADALKQAGFQASMLDFILYRS